MKLLVFDKFKRDTQILLHQQKSTIHATKRCNISTFRQNAKVHVKNGSSTELIKGKMDNIIRGALKRFSNNTLLKQPVNKLYPIENVRSNRQEPSDTENLAKSIQEAA